MSLIQHLILTVALIKVGRGEGFVDEGAFINDIVLVQSGVISEPPHCELVDLLCRRTLHFVVIHIATSLV